MRITNNINSSGSVNALPFGSSEKLSNEKKQWPGIAHIINNGNKTETEREIDRKLLQNKAMDVPVRLNIGGTNYEVRN